MCVGDIDFAYFYGFDILFFSCGIFFFIFSSIVIGVTAHHRELFYVLYKFLEKTYLLIKHVLGQNTQSRIYNSVSMFVAALNTFIISCTKYMFRQM